MNKKQKKFFLETLGCPKNETDSDLIRKKLFPEISETFQRGKADYIIVNTCAFIKPAIDESERTIEKYLKVAGKNQKIIITGCYLGRDSEAIVSRFGRSVKLVKLNEFELFKKMENLKIAAESLKNRDTDFIRKTGGRKLFAYVKISEGCGKKCGFCIIPKIKGKYISRPINEILIETDTCSKKESGK